MNREAELKRLGGQLEVSFQSFYEQGRGNDYVAKSKLAAKAYVDDVERLIDRLVIEGQDKAVAASLRGLQTYVRWDKLDELPGEIERRLTLLSQSSQDRADRPD